MSPAAFSNPAAIHAPLGAYAHAARVPAGAEMLYISGQVGVRPDGTLPTTLGEQADQAFANIGAILSAHGMTPRDVVKLTTFIVAGQAGAEVGPARARLMGDHRPAATAVYVPQLFAPEWLVEIEAVAVRA